MARYILLLVILPLYSSLYAQQVKIIPGFTGYALPAGKDGLNDIYFDSAKGASNWRNKSQSLHYFFYVNEPGRVEVALELINPASSSSGQVKWTCNKQQHLAGPVTGTKPVASKAGSLSFSEAGFYEMILSMVKPGAVLPSVKSIRLTGDIAASIHANQQARRNAASVHLRYPFNDTVKAVGFYNEITVPKGKDPLYSYYMACGFSRGYFGMQVNSETERRIIFSVWDSGKEPLDRALVKEADKVQLTAKGEGVVAEGFGNEGTGGHSHWIYNWKADSTYRFYVTALPDSNETYYTGYFFVPELQRWKMIAAFKSPKDGKYLSGLYSFLENFEGSNGQLHRKAVYSNGWIQTEDKEWKELDTAVFTYDATGRAGDRIDYDAGLDSGQFFLANGGFRKGNVKYKDQLTRPATAKNPIIDLYKNADSAITANRERQQIFKAIASGQYDTTGTVSGVYYKILKEGTGRNVLVNDTVTAFYKGSILGGDIFDQTKDELAVFPLNRLIKGWQAAVPMCKIGGKIRLIIPSAMAYSIRTRSPKIPPNSVLVFEIEIVNAKSPG